MLTFASLAAASVVLIYGVWRLYGLTIVRRQRQLRQRVAYMLWHAADKADRHSGNYPRMSSV